MPDREDCYRRIQEAMAIDIADYYKQFPDRQFDHRSLAAIAASFEGLKKVIAILEDYDITKKNK